jgi:hypothetical protein
VKTFSGDVMNLVKTRRVGGNGESGGKLGMGGKFI